MSSAYDNSGIGLKATIQESFVVHVPQEMLWLILRVDAEGLAQVSMR